MMVMVVADVFSRFRAFRPVVVVVISMAGRLRSSDAGMVMVVGMVGEHHIVVIKIVFVTVVMMEVGAAALPFGFWRGFLGELPGLWRFPGPEGFTCRRHTLGRPFLDVLDLGPHLMVRAE